MRATIGLILGVLMAVPGCNLPIGGSGPLIRGSGVTKEETREVPAFTGVDVSASFEAIVTIGPKASVVLSADDNLLPLIKTEVKKGHLVVAYAPGNNVQATTREKVTIVVPSVDYLAARGASKINATIGETRTLKVELSGASRAKVEGIVSDSVDVDAAGASEAILVGRGRQISLEVSGSSKFIGGEASFEAAKVSITGASQGEILATKSVAGTISGASSLRVRGEPKERSVETSGASSVSY